MKPILRRKTQPSLYQVEQQTIREYVQEHRNWSQITFGEGDHTEGLLRHIEKEMKKVRNDPENIFEWIDIMILAMDGAWRVGFTPDQIASALIEKQNINRARTYPKITDPSEPTEHVWEEQDG